jgi:hypothetical protein
MKRNLNEENELKKKKPRTSSIGKENMISISGIINLIKKPQLYR